MQNVQGVQNVENMQGIENIQNTELLSPSKIDPAMIHQSVPLTDMNQNYGNAFDPNFTSNSNNNLQNIAGLAQNSNVPVSSMTQNGAIVNPQQLNNISAMQGVQGMQMM